MQQNNKHKFQAVAELLIRRPVEEVFEAFVDPNITTKFWFTGSSGELEEGAEITWVWEMYDFEQPVFVKTLIPNKKLVLLWGEEQHATVKIDFTMYGQDHCFVSIKNWGFKGGSSDIAEQINDAAGGFTMVLAGLKAYLEHGIQLNLINDRYPVS